jgi:dienelactone hydrolase
MTKASLASLFLGGVFMLTVLANPLRAETENTISTRDDVTVSFVVTETVGAVKSVAILFAGGTGKIKLWKGRGPRGKNFLVRSRNLFAQRGVLTITVDVASDRRRKGLIFWRDSDEYRQDIAAVIKWIKAKEKAPLWLIGTSRGSVSVAYLAGSLPVDGAVFTATVTEVSNAGKPTAHDADLRKIKVPSLIAHHKEDACSATPVDSLPAFAAALKNTPKVETILFDGGDPDISGPCKAQSAHGFLGIEDQVVGRIVDWMHANAPK